MDDEVLEDLKRSAFPLTANERGVYLLFDGDELVYIGKGANCLLRVAEHTRCDSTKSFTSWNYLPVPEDDELEPFERYLIETHKPKYNVQYNRALSLIVT